jgi:hypothetical protein
VIRRRRNASAVIRWAEPAHIYAGALLDPPLAAAAVNEALDRLGSERRETADAETVLTALRDIVAQRMASSDAVHGPVRVVDWMPVLLAARASSRLDPVDVERLTRHLASCSACASVEGSMSTAERAFHRAFLTVAPAPTGGRHHAHRRPLRRRLAVPAAMVAVGGVAAGIASGAFDASPRDEPGPLGRGDVTIAAAPGRWPPGAAPVRPAAGRRHGQDRSGVRHGARNRARPRRRTRRPAPAPVIRRRPPTLVIPAPVQRPRTRTPLPTAAPERPDLSREPLPSPPSPAPRRRPPTD